MLTRAYTCQGMHRSFARTRGRILFTYAMPKLVLVVRDAFPARGGGDCVVDETGTTKTCFRVPGFAPTAFKGGSGEPVAAAPAPDGS
jgi:hypothetical protein